MLFNSNWRVRKHYTIKILLFVRYAAVPLSKMVLNDLKPTEPRYYKGYLSIYVHVYLSYLDRTKSYSVPTGFRVSGIKPMCANAYTS